MFTFTFYIYFHISFANVYSYDVRVSSSSAICVCWCCFFTFAKHVTRYNALPAICVKCKSGTNRDWVTRSENCFAEVMTEQKSCRTNYRHIMSCMDVSTWPTYRQIRIFLLCVTHTLSWMRFIFRRLILYASENTRSLMSFISSNYYFSSHSNIEIWIKAQVRLRKFRSRPVACYTITRESMEQPKKEGSETYC